MAVSSSSGSANALACFHASRPKPEEQVLPCPYLISPSRFFAQRRSPNPIRGSRLNGSIHSIPLFHHLLMPSFGFGGKMGVQVASQLMILLLRWLLIVSLGFWLVWCSLYCCAASRFRQDARLYCCAGGAEEDRLGVDRESAGYDGGRGEGVDHFPLRIQGSRRGLVMWE